MHTCAVLLVLLLSVDDGGGGGSFEQLSFSRWKVNPCKVWQQPYVNDVFLTLINKSTNHHQWAHMLLSHTQKCACVKNMFCCQTILGESELLFSTHVICLETNSNITLSWVLLWFYFPLRLQYHSHELHIFYLWFRHCRCYIISFVCSLYSFIALIHSLSPFGIHQKTTTKDIPFCNWSELMS